MPLFYPAYLQCDLIVCLISFLNSAVAYPPILPISLTIKSFYLRGSCAVSCSIPQFGFMQVLIRCCRFVGLDRLDLFYLLSTVAVSEESFRMQPPLVYHNLIQLQTSLDASQFRS